MVDGRLVKAAFNMRKAVAASFDKESDAGDLNTTDKDAKEGDTRRASRRRQQSSAGTLFGEHGSQQANRVWKNGRLVPETEAADEQSEA